MHNTIWKFPLQTTDHQVIEMPVGSEILSVQVQGGIVCMWALVNSLAPQEEREFTIYGTGNPLGMEPGFKYDFIGTYQLIRGALAFHLFEKKPKV